MYLKCTNKNIKELMKRLEKFDNENLIKFISYLLNLWNNDLINNLNVINPNLLDDDVDIKIFNPNSISYSYVLIKEIIEYFNYNFKLYELYPKDYISLIKVFEQLSFKKKKNACRNIYINGTRIIITY